MRRITKISCAIRVALAALWLVPGHVAHADKDEASLHAHVQFGRATMGEIDAPDETDTTPFAGVGARATYAISNWYAFEASLEYGQLLRQTVYTVDIESGQVDRSWHMAWTQAELGITARLGVRFIPTLHAALGLQHRTWQGGREIRSTSPGCRSKNPNVPVMCADELPDHATLDLLGTLGVGLDYRLGDRWVTGVAVTGQRAVMAEAPFHTIAVTFHFSYYFYPEGAGP